MNLKIYIMTHKKFPVPEDALYVPVQVGSALNQPLGYVRDDTGENISIKNKYYAELSGLYWVWKNDRTSDYVGFCHYRRYLIGEDNRTFSVEAYEKLFRQYDVIATKKVELENSYYEGYRLTHNIRDLQVTGEVIREKYPEYFPAFEKLVHENRTYFGNIFVMSKENFDRYAEWLFTIFAEVEKRVDLEGYDKYQQRVFGFISEFLQYVWIAVNGLRVYECRVGLIGEKFETTELKNRIEGYFRAKDIDGAKQYFVETLKRRPDLLMEASDVNGELAAAMQIVATADFERACGRPVIFEKTTDFGELVELIRELNTYVAQGREEEYAIEGILSPEALMVSKKLCTELKNSHRRWGGTDDKT